MSTQAVSGVVITFATTTSELSMPTQGSLSAGCLQPLHYLCNASTCSHLQVCERLEPTELLSTNLCEVVVVKVSTYRTGGVTRAARYVSCTPAHTCVSTHTHTTSNFHFTSCNQFPFPSHSIMTMTMTTYHSTTARFHILATVPHVLYAL